MSQPTGTELFFVMKLLLLLFRKPRGDKKGQTLPNNPSPPPSDFVNGGASHSQETFSNATLTSSSPHETLLYLEPKYAVFTRSLAECNIHDLIRQPTGVDKNEWIANNSKAIDCNRHTYFSFHLVVAFFNHVNALYNAMFEFCTETSCRSMIGPQNTYVHMEYQ